ncbi:hypothetical protein Agub_g9163 [Astrephomene gubernaculifera]|uniref:Poly(A) RNA polymerase mitochondrial-like central palm domain-containing protein n=1 Tax=Astrephomene gubernaculifera TaxID=47775 RepID=A0AAD3DSW5_9CHLO|nr:hypothetical protein Agub_g9163 [Astrephomene gubernaculifera]
MLPLPGAFHSPAMGCSGAVGTSARLACSASTPRCLHHSAASARPLAQAPSFCSAPQPPAMLQGLLHFRLSCPAIRPATAAARLHAASSVRTCALGRAAACLSPSTPSPLTSPLGSGPSMPCGLAPGSLAPVAYLGASGPCGPPPLPLPLGPVPVLAAAAAACPHALAGRPPQRHLATHAKRSSASDGDGASPPPPPTSASPSKKDQASPQELQGSPAPSSSSSSAAAAGGAAAPAAAAAGSLYSPLHHNIEEFCSRVVLTEGEKRARMEVIEGIRAGVRKVWPGARRVELQVFGSFANGLSTWGSDVDLVVTGISEPDKVTGGYEPNDRARITSRLRKLSEALHRGKQLDITRQQLIPRARIPILKLWTRNHVCVDISVSDDSGPRAARYMVQQCRAFPPLKPLVLVLKAYLKACKLNEVNTGGLSSYSLTNMVIAHLQEELKSGHDISDLGETLYTFLLRYGEDHDYSSMAVSVASGGIVPKSSLGFAMESARQAALAMGAYDGAVSWNERLCVDCPLTGRDVSTGTFRIDLVRGAFEQAARKLEALARGRRITDTSLNYLQALFDVNRVLKRSHPDPNEPYEDDYLRVIAGRGRAADAEEEEGEELLPGSDDLLDGEGEGEDDIAGDYLERSPTAAAATAAAAGGSSKGRQQRGR